MVFVAWSFSKIEATTRFFWQSPAKIVISAERLDCLQGKKSTNAKNIPLLEKEIQ